ncbi:MAG: hypothetical protein JST09_21045 [Bacteroidetes bacterium]|nr:hypothetical protein [Bacteroidota bacterium]MBS1608859.1 hypothetical protein [Bacteroidota bacterium]
MSFTAASPQSGQEHIQWIKDLDFYKDDLKILSHRLEEIVKKNNSHEVMAEVEHFQNQFIIQRNNIDELKHTIGLHTTEVAQEMKEHAGRIKNSSAVEHHEIKDQVISVEKSIQDLRREFNLFLSKWM